MPDTGQPPTDDRLRRVEDSISAQNRAIQLMLTNQKLAIEMLAKVLEAVTRTPDEDSDPLGELLAELVRASQEHGHKLDQIIRAQQSAR